MPYTTDQARAILSTHLNGEPTLNQLTARQGLKVIDDFCMVINELEDLHGAEHTRYIPGVVEYILNRRMEKFGVAITEARDAVSVAMSEARGAILAAQLLDRATESELVNKTFLSRPTVREAMKR